MARKSTSASASASAWDASASTCCRNLTSSPRNASTRGLSVRSAPSAARACKYGPIRLRSGRQNILFIEALRRVPSTLTRFRRPRSCPTWQRHSAGTEIVADPERTCATHSVGLKMPPEPRLRFVRPSVPSSEKWVPFLGPAYAAGRFSNHGPVVKEFERELREWCGVPERDVAVVSSATSGLVATLIALGVQGPVAMPAFTFPATAHAVRLAGCTPTFCDVDPDTWELDPRAAAKQSRRRMRSDHSCAGIWAL